MNRDLVINVNVNPNGQPAPTQAQPTQTAEANQNQQRSSGNAAKVAIMATIAQRASSIATAKIGDLTGNKTLQRNAQRIAGMATLGYAAITNPATAALLLGTQIGTQAISNSINNRNLQFQIDYNRTLKQNLYNNNRR
jgi:hypothetical protein